MGMTGGMKHEIALRWQVNERDCLWLHAREESKQAKRRLQKNARLRRLGRIIRILQAVDSDRGIPYALAWDRLESY